MENTKEKNSYIEVQEILKTTNIAGICNKDYEDLTQDDISIIKEFFGLIDSKLILDFSTEEAFEASMDVIFENNDRYSSGLLANVPDDKKEDFLRSVHDENITMFFNEKVINVYPKAYTIMMERAFGNSKFNKYFTNIDDDRFDFLQNCPKLSEEVDSFPTYGKINVMYYSKAIQLLADRVYKNVPEENMGKVIISYLSNTEIENGQFSKAFHFRKDYLKKLIPNDFVFHKKDYESIINYIDNALEQHLEDEDFLEAVMEHSTEEFKAEFVNHIIDKAYESVIDDEERKEASYYNGMIRHCIGKIDSSLVKNKDKVVDFFVDNNMGNSLKELLKSCEAEFVVEKFEQRMNDNTLQNSMYSTGTLYAFVKNLDFHKYKISIEHYTDVIEFAMRNCSLNIMGVIAKRGPVQYDTANFILKNRDFIKECDKKEKFIKLAIDSAIPGTIDQIGAIGLVIDMANLNTEHGQKEYKASCNDFLRAYSMDSGTKNEIITKLLKKTDKSCQNALYNQILYMMYKMCNNSLHKKIYAKSLSNWLELLPQDLIEEFVQNVDCIQDRFVQVACSNPEKYPNTVNAINSIREKTEYPDMVKFDEKIANKELLNNEEVIDFSDRIKKIRLKEGCIPEKYCDAIIRNTILTENKQFQEDSINHSMLMVSVIDKARHTLKREGIDDVHVFVDIEDINQGGYYNDKRKELSIAYDWIKLLYENKYNVINAVFHEVKHAVQYRDINNDDIQNPTEYEMIKLICIEAYNEVFYDINYESINYEIEARIAGRQKMYSYMQEIGIPTEKILEGDLDYNKDTYLTHNEYINEEVYKLDDSNKKFFVSICNYKTINEIFDELVRENPGIIGNYPTLSCEYNDDGTRKCDIEILEEYESKLLAEDYVEKEFNLYEHLINSSLDEAPDIQEAVMLKNADLLADYQPKTEKGKRMLDQIITKMNRFSMKQYGSVNWLSKESTGRADKAQYIQRCLSKYNEIKILKELEDNLKEGDTYERE